MGTPDASVLQQVPFFRALSPPELNEIVAMVHERRYRRGAVIFHEGDPGEAIFIVRRGRVKVYRLAPDGREQIIGIFTDGQPFGLVVLLDGAPYPASAEAVEETHLYMLRTRDLQPLLARHPNLAGMVMATAAGRLRRAQDRVHGLAVQAVHGRLAHLLLDLARERGRPLPGGWELELTLTHQELGGLIGASRETVTRVLADFRREKAVAIHGPNTLRLDEQKLRGWVEP